MVLSQAKSPPNIDPTMIIDREVAGLAVERHAVGGDEGEEANGPQNVARRLRGCGLFLAPAPSRPASRSQPMAPAAISTAASAAPEVEAMVIAGGRELDRHLCYAVDHGEGEGPPRHVAADGVAAQQCVAAKAASADTGSVTVARNQVTSAEA